MSLRKKLHTLEELVELQDKAIAALKLAIEALERARAEVGSQDKLPFGGFPAGGWAQPYKQPVYPSFQEPYLQPYTVPNNSPYTSPFIQSQAQQSAFTTQLPYSNAGSDENYDNYKKKLIEEMWQVGKVSYGQIN